MQAATADITTGTLVAVTKGFAAGMTGHVQDIHDQHSEGEFIGRRYLVELAGYGQRWFPTDFIEPYTGR